MLGVSNRTTWENYFKQPTIYNCDVRVTVLGLVYPFPYLLVADKSNIVSFTLKRRNTYVCENVMSDEVQLEILNWQDLSQATKNAIATPNREVHIFFKVQGDETTQSLRLNTYSYKVDRKSFRATIVFRDLFARYTSKGSGEVGVGNNPYAVDYYTTYAEYLQSSAIHIGGTFYLHYTLGTRFKTFTSLTLDGKYDGINVYDYEFEQDDPLKKNVTVYGATLSDDETTVTIPNVTVSQSASDPNFAHYYYLSATQRSSFAVFQKNGTTYQANRSDYSTYIQITPTNSVPEGSGYTIELKLKDVILDNVPANYDGYYIQTPAIQSGNTSSQQEIFRKYYKNDTFIDLDCRIDPTIEPLDIIETTLDGTLYNIVVEEVTINFNGGFTGHIRGRICNTLLKRPVIKDLDIPHGTFKIQNTNDTNVVCTIYYSGGSITLNINANSTLSCDIDDNVSQLEMSFSSKSMSELDDDVYCCFTATDYFDSENVIILESDN